ncbi:MAG: hypothetical protein TEF_21185 [Rhizobiales bacterium NRL2]|jgi:hypothetical protein|nr:MAG: hypothetical protein TEF_21185 [Rhizobiales bacterium NRL2]
MRRMFILPVLLFAIAGPVQADGLFGKAKDLLGGAVKNAPAAGGERQGGLSRSEIGAGLKEALRVGSGRVVDQVSAIDGFDADPAIHIPLPENLARAQSILGRLGMSNQLDALEDRLNRAAETAAARAKPLFVDAVEAMTIQDVMEIFNGPDDAATQYFRRQMTPGLRAEMKPVVDESLAEVGAIETYEQTVGEFRSMPMVPDLRADLTDHVLTLGLDGIFHYLAREEAAIRNNPAERTTALLQRVFGG